MGQRTLQEAWNSMRQSGQTVNGSREHAHPRDEKERGSDTLRQARALLALA